MATMSQYYDIYVYMYIYTYIHTRVHDTYLYIKVSVFSVYLPVCVYVYMCIFMYSVCVLPYVSLDMYEYK